ncbi:MAG TPA: pentapeptide repeat-containing protein [Acidimicrobiales bacterium]|nr:pentapeptide repeat-containing protein [Acidimicrobiales bacterium]
MGLRGRGERNEGRAEEPLALRRAGLVLLFGIGLTAAIAAIGVFWAPDWSVLAAEPQADADTVTAHRQAIRETAVRFATGAGAAVAGILAWGRLELSRREHRGAERAQNTDRYTRAVEQLGHTSDDVILGGLYALESLGKDSPADRATITEVLSAFVREHGDAEFAEAHGRQPVTVQAALTILGRTAWQPADLSGAALTKARLEGDLSYVLLFRADLTDADVLGADLTGANLFGADLSKAHLIHTIFQGAGLTGANLTDANLSRANLTRADLTATELIRANLTDADLTDAKPSYADLTGANLTGANLTGVDFSDANLSGADLTDANLVNADLSDANVVDANLADADLTGADLTGANLAGASLAGATMPPNWADIVGWRPDGTSPKDQVHES